MCRVGCGWLAARTRGREEVVASKRRVPLPRYGMAASEYGMPRLFCSAHGHAACFLRAACGSATWRSHPPIPHRGAGADCLPSTFSLPGYKRNPPGDTPDETPDDNPRRCTHLRTGRAPGHGWAGRAGGAAGLAAAAGRRGRVPAAARHLPYSHTGAGRCGEPNARVWRCVRTRVWGCGWGCVRLSVRPRHGTGSCLRACMRANAARRLLAAAGELEESVFCCLFRLQLAPPSAHPMPRQRRLAAGGSGARPAAAAGWTAGRAGGGQEGGGRVRELQGRGATGP